VRTLAQEPDPGRRLARLLALQEGLIAAARAADAGRELPEVLAAVLDRTIAPSLPLRAVLVDHEPDELPLVLARYPAGCGSSAPSPAEEAFSSTLLGAEQVRHEPAVDATAATSELPVHRLGLGLTVNGRATATLAFELAAGPGFEEDDRLVLEGVSTVVGAALAARARRREHRELERLRSDFISRISHELRTPLTIIGGFAGTLAAHDETLEPRQRHEMLDRIITATVRLEHLVDDVLSLASVEAGTREPDPVVVPVLDVIDLVVHDQRGNGRVEVVCAPSLRLCTDPSLARQALGPVVQNALQHGEQVHIEGQATASGARIVVTDDGPGVPTELGDRVFDRFVRGDDRTPGMGLGLAMARSAGAAIGAVLTREPTPTGARFALHLPDLATAARG
jgi:signal transduction histidine kinase